MRDAWYPMYDVAYCVACVIGQQLELVGKSGKIHKVNVQDGKVTNPVDELIKCLPDKKAFWHASKWHVQPKLIEHLHWLFSPKILPDNRKTIQCIHPV